MITRRASVTALVAVAVAGLASGCLSSNGGSGTSGDATASGPGKATVEVMYGFGSPQEALFQKDLNTFAQANGFTVKFTHGRVLGHRDPFSGRRWQPARRGPVPAARSHV